MRATHYDITAKKPGIELRAAVISDLHDKSYDKIIPILKKETPDVIFIPGDLTEELEYKPKNELRPGLQFLKLVTRMAPTFYSLGNHEIGACHYNLRHPSRLSPDRIPVCQEYKELILSTGAYFLDEDYVFWHGVAVGGIGSGLLNPGRVPVYDWLDDFSKNNCYKILLCHQPEYFDRYLRPYDIDLFVSGHAHGGQWQLFGRGIYAPDQPLFPKYTSGIHEGRLIISRGVANTAKPIPRLFNPCEVVILNIKSEN